MAYEKTLLAAEGTLAREQEYDYHWCYERGIITMAWLAVWEKTGQQRYFDAAKANVDKYVTPEGDILTYEMDKHNIDMILMGRTAIRMYKATGEARYQKACETLIAQLMEQPRTKEGGFWHKDIYPHQMWLDGIFMACPFMVEYAEAFGKGKWADEAVFQMTLIFEKTRLKNGLHVHAWDSAKAQPWADKQTGHAPHVWGRAMGWFAMAHVEVLRTLPKTHAGYAKIAAQLESLLAAIAANRGEDKLWHQVMDMPHTKENYAESSCSSMFIYVLSAAHHLGLAGKEAMYMAKESMDALWEKNVVIAADGYPELQRICKVAGLGGEPYRDGTYEYYINEVVCAGDTKGTAPFLSALACVGA